MKQKSNLRRIVFLVLSLCLIGVPRTRAEDKTKPAASRIDALEMRSVPNGNYLVNLQLDGQEQRVNIAVKDNAAKCVNSSAPRLNGMEGKFELIGNGVFTVFFQSEAGHRASQWWLFRNDGCAVVKEVPDRNEKQTATPVGDNAIEPPKKS